MWLLPIYSLPLVGILLTLIYRPWRTYFFTGKCIASLSFVCLAFWFGLNGTWSSTFLFYYTLGFIFCFGGDIFFGLFNHNRQNYFFIPGAVLFLFGHICFLTTFFQILPLSTYEAVADGILILLSVLFLHFSHLVEKNLRPVILLYAVFITLLLVRGLYLCITLRTFAAWCIGFGCTLFYVSDVILLFLYFNPHHPFTTHGWNLVTYYYGIFLLAAAMQFPV